VALSRETRLLAAAGLLMLALGVSGLRPYDRTTWLLEVAPILIALPILIGTYRRFPLTRLVYALIFVHALILMVGGAYTYARVPLGAWFASALSLSRNPYDKLGHFAQGFVPAIVAREVLARGRRVRGRGMLAFVVVSIVLAISASYELVEWLAAVSLGQGADEFLGTQGDPWDTQSDMLMALLGGLAAIATLSRVHDRQLRDLGSPPAGE
jgi:putative membrane protein